MNLKFFKKHRIVITVFLIVFVLGFAGSVIFYQSLSADQRVKLVRTNPLIKASLPIIRSIRNSSNILYLPYYLGKHDLDKYHLIIDQKYLNEMNSSLPEPFADSILTNEFKDWYTAQLITPDGSQFEVEIRYRGDNSIHWDSRKKSITVKLPDGQAYNGAKRLSFIIPHDRNFVLEHVHLNQSRKLGIPVPQSDFGYLTINGKTQGLYFITEGWNEAFLVKNDLSEETNFYGMAEAREWLGRLDVVFEDLGQWKSYTQDILTNYEDYSYADKFLEALNQWDDQYFHDHIFDLVDEDNFFNWLIAQNISSSTHENGVNLRLVFDNVIGKFKFITWDIGLYSPVFDPYKSTSPLINRILSSPDYLHKRNVLLWQYLNNEDGVEDDINFFDEMFAKIKVGLYQDTNKIYSNRWADKKIKEGRDLLVSNVDFWKSKLELSRAFVNIIIRPFDSTPNHVVTIEAIVDNPADLYLDTLDIDELGLDENSGTYSIIYDKDRDNKISNSDLAIGTFNSAESNFTNFDKVLLFAEREIPMDDNLPLTIKKTKHTFFVIATNPNVEVSWENLKIKFRNAITDEKVDKDNVLVKYLNGQVFRQFDLISADWLDVKRQFGFLGKTYIANGDIIFPAGVYNISQTFIVPKGYRVIINPGAQFIISPGISILSYSPIESVGSVLFTALDKSKGWGNLVIIDTPGQSKFINNIFEYGGESFNNGIFTSGMLSIFESDSIISGNIFRFALGDDGLNIKRGQAEITDNLFFKNSFDALDLDWTDSVVDSNMFLDNGNDSVDISSSRPIVRNNYIYNSGDKGVSVGENSQAIIYNNIINKAVFGVASKDLSEPIIFNNNIINAQSGIGAYQKKEIFGGSKPWSYNNIFYSNEKIFDTDSVSEIKSKGDFYPGIENYQDLVCDSIGLCDFSFLDDGGQVYKKMLDYIESSFDEDDNFNLGIFDEQSISSVITNYRSFIQQ